MEQKKEEQKEEQLVVLKTSDVINSTEWEEKQNKILEENPFITITDLKTYKEAKNARTNLVRARTSLTSQQTLLVSHINTFKDKVKEETQRLIGITKTAEDKQQKEVKRYETYLQEEKEKEQKREEERVKRIEQKLEEFKNSLNTCIESVTIDNHAKQLEEFEQIILIGDNYEYEEFFITYDEIVLEYRDKFKNKVEEIAAEEEERLKEIKINAYGQTLLNKHGFSYSENTEEYKLGNYSISKSVLSVYNPEEFNNRVEEIKESKKQQEQLLIENQKAKKEKEEQLKLSNQREGLLKYLPEEMNNINSLSIEDLTEDLRVDYINIYDNAASEKFNLVKTEFKYIRESLISHLDNKIESLQQEKKEEEAKEAKAEETLLERIESLKALGYTKNLENNNVVGFGTVIKSNTIKYADEESFKSLLENYKIVKSNYLILLEESKKIKALVDLDKKTINAFLDDLFSVLQKGVSAELSEHSVKFFAGEISEIQKTIEEVRRNVENL